MKSVFLIACAAILFVSCAHDNSKKGDAERPKAPDAPASVKSAPDAGSSIEAKQLAATEMATYVTEIKFSKEKARLTAEAGARLKKIFEQAKAKGELGEIKVVAWADAEFPSIYTKKLPQAQLDLAQKRLKTVDQYFKDLGVPAELKISDYSMAERTTTIASLMGSQDAQIKKSLETAGIPNTDTSSKVNAKASRAIVMIFLKEGPKPQ